MLRLVLGPALHIDAFKFVAAASFFPIAASAMPVIAIVSYELLLNRFRAIKSSDVRLRAAALSSSFLGFVGYAAPVLSARRESAAVGNANKASVPACRVFASR